MSERTHETDATVDDWIGRESIPLSFEPAEAFNTSVDQMMAALGDTVELLGIGEPLHGGEDFLILRNRLFQRLIEAYGYTAIALESSFPKSYFVNEYILGRTSSPYETLIETGFSHRFGQLEANRELVEWMRTYNVDPSHPVKLHFYGFDSPTEMTGTDSPRQLLYLVLDYLAAFDQAIAQDYRQRIDSLLGEDAAWENPAAMMDAAQSIGLSSEANALRLETENLISELHIHRPEWIVQGGEDRYLEALQFAVEARQLLNYHAELARPAASEQRMIRCLGLRDAIMAHNLEYIVSRERSRGKVLAFAHNSHLQSGQAHWQLGTNHLVWWWPVGAHLDAMFGERYAVIGAALGVSAANGVGEPEAGTLEARLVVQSGDGRFIPTHKGRGLPMSEIESLPLRSGNQRNPSYFPLTRESLTDFDWLVMLNSTAFSRGWPPLAHGFIQEEEA